MAKLSISFTISLASIFVSFALFIHISHLLIYVTPITLQNYCRYKFRFLYCSQNLLAALTEPHVYVELLCVLLRAANHFYGKYNSLPFDAYIGNTAFALLQLNSLLFFDSFFLSVSLSVFLSLYQFISSCLPKSISISLLFRNKHAKIAGDTNEKQSVVT